MESDGSVFSASPSGVISVPDEYSGELAASNAVRNGILRVGRTFNIGTRNGRRCVPCKRTWQSWSEVCPRCEQPTVPE